MYAELMHACTYYLQVDVFVPSHPYGKAFAIHQRGFQRMLDSDYTDVYFLWGMRPQDTSSCNQKSSQYCIGTTVWDDNFNPSSEKAQTHLKVRIE